MQYAMFLVMRDIRHAPVPELAKTLYGALTEGENADLRFQPDFRLSQQTATSCTTRWPVSPTWSQRAYPATRRSLLAGGASPSRPDEPTIRVGRGPTGRRRT